VPQLIKRLVAFYRSRRFISVFTTSHHLSLSCARLTQFTPSLPVSLRYFLILFSHLCLKSPGGVSFLQDSQQNSVSISLVLHTCHVPRLDNFLRIIYQIFGNECKSLQLLIVSCPLVSP